MREIKFRAWDKANKEMLVIDTMQLMPMSDGEGGMTEPWVGFETKGGSGLCPLSLVELMQYTGLKDKNGKEIYEGDVVKVREHLIGRFASNTIRIVEFSRGSFLFTVNKVGDPMVMWLGLEVIGNIHENPELLIP